MNDNLDSVSSSVMERTRSPASIPSFGAETDLQSPPENFDADMKRVRALAQSRVQLEDYIRTTVKDWQPSTVEAIIKQNIDSAMKELERMKISEDRMEMAEEAREKE